LAQRFSDGAPTKVPFPSADEILDDLEPLFPPAGVSTTKTPKAATVAVTDTNTTTSFSFDSTSDDAPTPTRATATAAAAADGDDAPHSPFELAPCSPTDEDTSRSPTPCSPTDDTKSNDQDVVEEEEDDKNDRLDMKHTVTSSTSGNSKLPVLHVAAAISRRYDGLYQEADRIQAATSQLQTRIRQFQHGDAGVSYDTVDAVAKQVEDACKTFIQLQNPVTHSAQHEEEKVQQNQRYELRSRISSSSSSSSSVAPRSRPTAVSTVVVAPIVDVAVDDASDDELRAETNEEEAAGLAHIKLLLRLKDQNSRTFTGVVNGLVKDYLRLTGQIQAAKKFTSLETCVFNWFWNERFSEHTRLVLTRISRIAYSIHLVETVGNGEIDLEIQLPETCPLDKDLSVSKRSQRYGNHTVTKQDIEDALGHFKRSLMRLVRSVANNIQTVFDFRKNQAKWRAEHPVRTIKKRKQPHS